MQHIFRLLDRSAFGSSRHNKMPNKRGEAVVIFTVSILSRKPRRTNPGTDTRILNWGSQLFFRALNEFSALLVAGEGLEPPTRGL